MELHNQTFEVNVHFIFAQFLSEAGTGSVQEKPRADMGELIDLFGKDTTDQDQLLYVNGVIKGKMLESETLQQQAANNTKKQFGNSPDLNTELDNAIMEALDAHKSMSTRAVNSEDVKNGMLRLLLDYGRLWEELRAKAG